MENGLFALFSERLQILFCVNGAEYRWPLGVRTRLKFMSSVYDKIDLKNGSFRVVTLGGGGV